MTDDLEAILNGQTAAPAGPTGGSAAPAKADPTDYLIRTVYGERDPGNPDSERAIASVVVNRAAKSGKRYDEVVQEPGQFEPWGDPKARERMLALDPNSADYKAIAQNIAPVISGEVKLPYTQFYSPSVLADRGQAKPDWDNGAGVKVGSQLFFGGEPSGDLAQIMGGAPDTTAGGDAFAKAFGGTPGAPGAQPEGPATIKTVDGKIVFGDSGAPVPDAQAKTITTLAKGGYFAQDGKPGSINMPWVQRNLGDTFQPGDFYIASNGQLVQTPGGPKTSQGGAGEGVAAGLGDIPNSLFKLIPGHEGSDVYNAAEANRLIYDATHQGDRGAQAGRFMGQVAASTPLLLAGGSGLGALTSRFAPEALAPALDFLAGNAGKGGNLLVRGGSLAARGAQEGTGAALLTSGTSDRPLGEQLAEGAITGAVLNPLLPGAGALVTGAKNRLFGEGGALTPAVRDLAQLATDKYGIPLRTTQIQGVADRNAAVKDSELIGKPETGYGANQAEQTKAFTRAVAKTFGADADALTPEVMSGAKRRIGGVFDTVAKNTAITDTNGLTSSLNGVVDEARQVLTDPEVAPLAKQVEAITSAIKDGQLSGESYQALTRDGSPLDRASESANPNIRYYAQQLRDKLDDALEGAASDADRQALTQARWQYKNLMTVKNLAAKANVEGEISPRLLNGAVNTSFKNRAFSGAGDLGELAQIGQTFMKEPPNSGTAPRLLEKLKPYMLGAGGLGEGWMLFHDPGTALKLAGGAAAAGALRYGGNMVTGAMGRSPARVNRLIAGDTNDAGPAIAAAINRLVGPSAVPAGVIAVNDARGGDRRALPAR